MGKTTLAIRAAELVMPGQFDRIFFLSSKERRLTAEGEKRLSDFVTPGYLNILNEIARLLKNSDIAKEPETDRPRLVIEALVPAKALLILDNLESLPKDHQSRLFDFLSLLPVGCKAIATSRLRTDVDARIIRLAKLDPDAAQSLLDELAIDRPLLAKATARERTQLYEETGGNPLLLRWVAGQLGRGRCRTVAAALDLLRSASSDNDPLEFIFGDLLGTFTESETKVLAALTYFTRPVAVNLIAELANISSTAAETALGDLSSRALVIPDEEEKQFALVAMVAVFLRRKRPEVVAETNHRFEERAYALVVENGYENFERFPVLHEAWPTIAPAFPFFVSGPNARLQTVAAALFQFCNFSGRYDESLSLNLQAEAKAVAADDPYNAGWRAYQAGWIHRLREESDDLLACAERAEKYWKEAGSGAREQATAINLRGLAHYLKREFPAAIEAFREVLKLDQSLDAESNDVAIDLNTLADAERLSGDLDAAEVNYREGLRIAQAVEHAESIENITGNLALLMENKENWPEAEKLSREALRLAKELGRKETIALHSQTLANSLAHQGKRDEALPYAERAVEIFTELGIAGRIEDANKVLEDCQP